MTLTFAPPKEKVYTTFCPTCGLPLADGEVCGREHKRQRKERIGKYSGQSKFFKGGYERRD